MYDVEPAASSFQVQSCDSEQLFVMKLVIGVVAAASAPTPTPSGRITDGGWGRMVNKRTQV